MAERNHPHHVSARGKIAGCREQHTKDNGSIGGSTFQQKEEGPGKNPVRWGMAGLALKCPWRSKLRASKSHWPVALAFDTALQ